MRRPLFSALAVIGLLALALALGAATPRGSKRDGDWPALAGLSAPVRIVTDRWGVPHVRAENLPDLYRGWGWVTARDRLAQLVQLRQAGHGRTHVWFGNDALQDDGGAQLFRLRERAETIWARDRRDPAVRSALENYSAGINAYLGACRDGRRPWPPELVALHERPLPWRPEDSVLLLLGMGVDLDLDLSDLRDARTVREHGIAWLKRRRRFEDRWTYDTVPDRGTSSVPVPIDARSNRESSGGGWVALPATTVAAAEQAAALEPAREADGADRASNVMAVGPQRSASGRPLLANDLHLALTAPGPVHLVHVMVPGIVDAVGAALPGLPAIVSGRNRRCAWGVTALGADGLDVYADTLSADGRRVKSGVRWVPVVEAPYDLQFRVLGIPLPAWGQVRRYTPHGPVLVWDPRHHLALAARWSAMAQDERITLTRLVGVERSRDAREIVARFRSLVTPEINCVAADVGGALIYQATGLVPKRLAIPDPGVTIADGRHEWIGFIPPDSMPSWDVPANGFVVNGNNRPAHASSPWVWAGYGFAQDRAVSMAQRLAGDRRVTLADLASVQNDTRSRASGRQLPALLAAIAPGESSLPRRARAALDTLRNWNLDTRRWLVAPTLARAWWNAYLRRAGLEGLPGLGLATLRGEAQAEPRARGERAESPADAAAGGLQTALDTLASRLGPDLRRWTWDRAHRARFRNALAAHGLGAGFEPPDVAVDGDGSTVSVGGSRAPWGFSVTHGPVVRQVTDLADSSTSWAVIPPWNSAEAGAAGADMRLTWSRHGYFPLHLDWPAVEAGAARTEWLVP